MFTGIIEEIGKIEDIVKGEISSKLIIKGKEVIKGTKLGDSIATNGVCLTVTSINDDLIEMDVMGETLRKTTLGELRRGNLVNLERALTLDKRLGGHIVSGHIDGVGKVISIEKEGISTWITIEAKSEILKYIILKGSIAIDGISLTVAYVDDHSFKVSIIPHTAKETTLFNKGINELVNLECDQIGKYIEKLLLFKNKDEECKSSFNQKFLIENGFM
ncbi:MAG: riboflavin synthase [Clostridium sp.]